MHEVGLMQSVLDLAEDQARRAGASQIHEVRLRIGQLSGVVSEAMDAAFGILRQGTLASEASLTIETVSGACWCRGCNREFETSEQLCECPTCGALSAELRRGRELELISLEIS